VETTLKNTPTNFSHKFKALQLTFQVVNIHVISGASQGWAKLVGQSNRHEVLGVVAADYENDLVLLALKGANTAPVLELADSSKVAIGEEIFAIGNPQGLEGTISSGIVSGIRAAGNATLIQITAPISPGSSGGPVLDTQGKVVGVAVATFRGGQNLNFAIPSEKVASLMQKITTPLALGKLEKKNPDMSRTKIIGGKAIEGVLAAHVDCFKPDPSNPFMNWDCSFSVQNKLQVPVANVRAILILWGKDSSAIDVREAFIRGPIRPGLAVRSEKYVVETNVRQITARLEARILDFRILE
jgi:S1-C subfamily serine protease